MMATMLATILPLLSLAIPLASASPTQTLSRHQYVGQETTLTFFGYPDNCDSTGCYYAETAYSCSNPDGSNRDGAQGDGSYDDPLSMAFQPGGNFQQCAIVYVEYLQKFGIMDGLCASCDVNHIDIWVQSSCSDDASDVCQCEDNLTPTNGEQYVLYGITSDDTTVFSVNTTPLYDGGCTGHTYQEGSRSVRRAAGG